MKHLVVLAVALASCADPQPIAPVAPVPSSLPAPVTASAAPSASAPTAPSASAAATAPAPQLAFTSRPVALPGATGPVSLDYLAVDRAAGRVWIPAGGTGSVDMLEAASGKLTRIEGFPTVEKEMRGKKRSMGPSSATIGEGFVYTGNRANSQVCAIDMAKLTRGECVKLASSPDGVQFVATTHEVWVTTPRDKSITILDASKPAKLKVSGKITLEGDPEGYAIDPGRGVFYTNLEDKDKTLAIDVRTRKVTSTWDPQCGSEGPRGLAIDTSKGWLFVACTDHVEVLDTAHGGALVSRLDTGAGVDNIDYLDTRGQLYVAAGKAAMLTVAQVGEKGELSVLGKAPTSEGTRVVVVDANGAAYVTDPMQGRILVLTPSH